MAMYDESELNVTDGLEYSMNDKDLYIEILETYLEETSDELARMDTHLANEDMLQYATLVHAIKSSSRLIGAGNLGEVAYDMELRAKEGNVEYIKSKHDALKAHVQVVFDCIKAYMAE